MVAALSPRLRAIADAVAPGEPMADVGTDHGLLPTQLLVEGRVPRAFALDLRPAPLARARARAAALGLGEAQGFVARLSDGLGALRPGEASTAVFAGLGGALMTRALAARPDLARAGAPGGLRRIVAQPNLEPERVRAWAREAGWTLAEERVVVENGRFFVVLALTQALTRPDWTAEDLRFGPLLRAARPPAWLDMLRADRQRLARARAEAAPRAGAEALAALDRELDALDRELAGA